MPFMMVGLAVVLWLPAGGLMTLAAARGETLCVRPDGQNDCYPTIQEAVNAAEDGDQILIAAGTYTESVTITKSLTITGGWQPAGWVLTETVVQADGAECALAVMGVSGRVKELAVTGAATAGLCGEGLAEFTLEQVIAHHNQGDGVVMDPAGSITVTHSTFEDNLGHGLNWKCGYDETGTFDLLVRDSVAIRNRMNGFDGAEVDGPCRFNYERVVANENEAAGWGGFGASCPLEPEESLSGLPGVTIVGSEAAGNQYGLRSFCAANFLLDRNHIHHNQTGILLDEAAATSVNNLIVQNEESGVLLRGWANWTGMNDTLADNGGPAFALVDDVVPFPRPESACDTPAVNLTNTIAWGELPAVTWEYSDKCAPFFIPFYVNINYGLVTGLNLLVSEPGVINFSIGPAVYDFNPFFVGNGDYHLRSPSLAIDAGTEEYAPVIDFDGNPRPQDGDTNGTQRFDIGAYESSPLPFEWTYLPQVK